MNMQYISFYKRFYTFFQFRSLHVLTTYGIFIDLIKPNPA